MERKLSTDYRVGDIVKIVKELPFPYNRTRYDALGLERTVTRIIAGSDQYPFGLVETGLALNLEPGYFELAYRPPTREEYTALKEAAQELVEADKEYYRSLGSGDTGKRLTASTTRELLICRLEAALEPCCWK